MSFCQFGENTAMFDATPVDNLFLTEFMPTMSADEIKLYLFTRMVAYHPEIYSDMESMESVLRMTHDDVIEIYAKLERRGLVTRVSDHPPIYALLAVRSNASKETNMDKEFYRYSDMHAEMQNMFIDKMIHPRTWEMIHEFIDTFGLTQGAVLLLIKDAYSRTKSKSPDPDKIVASIKKKVEAYAGQGAHTENDIIRLMHMNNGDSQLADRIAERLSLNRKPTEEELNLVHVWHDEWNFSDDEIEGLCAETVKSRNPNFGYLNSILKNRMSGDDALFTGARKALEKLSSSNARPTAAERAQYAEFLQKGFQSETILLAAQVCHEARRTHWQDLCDRLKKWEEDKLFDYTSAKANVDYWKGIREEIRSMFTTYHCEQTLRMADYTLYEGWKKEFPFDMITYAFELAAGKKGPLSYINTMLNKWKASGFTGVEQAKTFSKPTRETVNPALQYEQRPYDPSTDDDSELIIDLNAYSEE